MLRYLLTNPLFSLIAWKQRLVFWLGAILVGALIVSLIVLSEWAGALFRTSFDENPLLFVAIPPFGLALTTWLTFRFFPGAEGSGIPQVKTALAMTGDLSYRMRLISIRIALGKILLPILGLLSGASVGLGGPSVQIGASVMASLGKAVKFPPHFLEKGLILAGSAAGFAAMFSAPLAGIIFAIEELGRALEEQISSLVLTAIIFSGMTAYAILNVYIFFDDRSLVLPWDKSWIAIPLCGVIGGLAGGLFSVAVIGCRKPFAKGRCSIVCIAFFAGILISAIGYYSGGATFGTGYPETKAVLHGEAQLVPGFPFLKMLSTIATVLSGIPSGIFVPSLSTGAGLGNELARWIPVAPGAAMILLTMSAYFSGMLHSPITSFVIVMEITDTSELAIPLMATALIATGTSKLICPTPLYRALCDDYGKYLDRIKEKRLVEGGDSKA
ncbi:MAG: chloride channel protein [Gammaproteobacteria bacterium]